MNRLIRLALTLLAIATPLAAGAAEKPRVVATFSVIGDLVANIAGDHIELTTLVGPDGDTELYAPTAADIPKLAKAQVVFMNGLNDEFEPWLEKLLMQAKFAGTKIVVSRDAKVLTAETETKIGAKPKPIALDQHAWLDPRNALIYVKNIADALARMSKVMFTVCPPDSAVAIGAPSMLRIITPGIVLAVPSPPIENGVSDSI